MNPEEFRTRTRKFGLRVIRWYEALPERGAAQVLGHQLPRAATPVGANHRTACRAKSRADFISKLGNVEQECDESVHWLEMLVEGGFIKPSRVSDLISEANELLALTVSPINTANGRGKSAIRNPRSAIG